MTEQQPTAETTGIVSIKGFGKDFKCRDFQFEVGKTYSTEGEIKACSNGFHAVDADDPLHVWDFYPVVADDGTLSRYAEVVQSGAMDREVTGGGTKVASANIAISVEISLPDFIRRAVDAMISKIKAASGYYSKLAASGHSSQLAASGHSSQLAASGHSSKLAASGGSSKLAASGHYSKLAASGHSSKLAASGHSSKLAASGENCVIAAAGPGCSANGSAGTHIALAEFDNAGKCVGFATGCVGVDGVEPNVAYVAKGGKLVKA